MKDEEVLRRRAAMLFGKEAIDKGDRFTTLIVRVFDECGIAPEDRGGYLMGWLYAQLRKNLSAQEVRAMFVSGVELCEARLSILEKNLR